MPRERPELPPARPRFPWAPGSWVWNQNRYVWQPGYWVQAKPNWVWIPAATSRPPAATSTTTATGTTRSSGGAGLRPGRLRPSAYAQPSFAYSPSIVLPVAGLLSSLFVRPSYGQYYFGDYYNAASQRPRSGYVPWFGLQQNRLGYDPLYASMSALNARQPGWDRGIREEYQHRLDNRQLRPASTFEGQRALIEQRGVAAKTSGAWAWSSP